MIEPANATTSQAQDIATAIAPMIIDIAHQHGEIVTIFALIGMFAVFNTMVRISMPILEVAGMVFIVTPFLIIHSLTTKEKRHTFRDEIREVKEYSKKNPKAVIGFVLYILGFVVLVLALTAVSMHFGI